MKFKADQTSQKLRGGYYTPQIIADYIMRWILAAKPKSILEPSCGDGVFISAVKNVSRRKAIKIDAFELFDSEIKKCREKIRSGTFSQATVREGDFLEWFNKNLRESGCKYDAVVGNPPFIRYQFLEASFQAHAEQVFKQLNLKFTKHTNAWVPFLIASIDLLKDGGRLGMVVPSEIVNVMHAQSLRDFFFKKCKKIVIIDPQEIWFEGTLQGAVIVLAEKKEYEGEVSQGVGIKAVKGNDFLNDSPCEMYDRVRCVNGYSSKGKWTRAFLTKREIDLLNHVVSHDDVHKFDDIASVDVGIVTGANKFFLVDNKVVDEYDLQQYAHPMFGKSQHCKGIVYDEKQHSDNGFSEYPTNFIYIEDDFDMLPSKVKKYIKYGERQDFHKRYKCRIRKPWYKVPSIHSSQVGMLKRSHEAPRAIYNELGAFTTDTAYRIHLNDIDPKLFVCCFLSPITAIFSELEGRYYGGGVLELVPSEIEKLYVPLPKGINFNIDDINVKVKQGEISKVIEDNGRKLVRKLGFTRADADELYAIWEKLKNRRLRKG